MAEGSEILNDIYNISVGIRAVINTVSNRVGSFLDQSISSGVQAVNDLAAKLQEATVNTINNMTKFLGSVIEGVQNTVNGIAQTVSYISDTVNNITSAVVSQLSAVIDSAVDTLKTKINEVVEGVTEIVNQIKSEIQQVGYNLEQSLNSTKDFLNKSITSGIDTVSRGIEDVKDTTVAKFIEAKNVALNIFDSTVITIQKSTSDVIREGVKIFDKTIAFIDTSITGLAQGFADLFENFQTYFGTIFSDFQKFLTGILTIDEEQMYQRMARLAEKYKQVQNTIIPKS